MVGGGGEGTLQLEVNLKVKDDCVLSVVRCLT